VCYTGGVRGRDGEEVDCFLEGLGDVETGLEDLFIERGKGGTGKKESAGGRKGRVKRERTTHLGVSVRRINASDVNLRLGVLLEVSRDGVGDLCSAPHSPSAPLPR
jgi:hypothetical protein